MTQMELQSILFGLTAFIGFISLSKTILTFLRWVWIAFLRPSKNLKDYGTWALVTGPTDGIGKAIAFELASKGLNLVLVGRDLLKLERTSNALREAYGSKVQIKYIVIDFAKAKGTEIVKKLEEEINGLDVGVVINNAGMANSYAEYFHLIDSQVSESIVRVNVDGATWVTKAVLPLMLKKKKGAIVNIGSASSLIPLPLSSVYSATKSYMEMFSRCINLEYKHTGIHVQCQAPFVVATKMVSIRRSSFFIPSAEMYGKASVRQIGYENVCTPYWTHYIFWCILDALPEALRDRIVLDHYLTLREKGLQKMSVKNNKKNP